MNSNQQQINCPICRSITPETIENLKINFSLMEMISSSSKEEKKSCGECSSDATVFCHQCNAFLCQAHDEQAHAMKITSTHTRSDFRSDNIQKSPMRMKKCPEHEKSCKLFCNDCHLSICTFCRDYGVHKNHQTDLITNLINIFKSEIQQMVQKTELYIFNIKNNLEQYTDNIKKIDRISERIDSKIDFTFDSLINSLNERRNTLKREMKEIAIEEKKIIDADRESIVTTISNGNGIVSELKNHLNSEEDFSVVLEEKKNTENWKQRIQQIEKSNGDISNKRVEINEDSYIPFQFDFQLVEDIIQNCGAVGPSERKRNEISVKEVQKRKQEKVRKSREELTKKELILRKLDETRKREEELRRQKERQEVKWGQSFRCKKCSGYWAYTGTTHVGNYYRQPFKRGEESKCPIVGCDNVIYFV